MAMRCFGFFGVNRPAKGPTCVFPQLCMWETMVLVGLALNTTNRMSQTRMSAITVPAMVTRSARGASTPRTCLVERATRAHLLVAVTMVLRGDGAGKHDGPRVECWGRGHR